jgi:predicted RNase H-like nuclease (RuvC/YqgF family)
MGFSDSFNAGVCAGIQQEAEFKQEIKRLRSIIKKEYKVIKTLRSQNVALQRQLDCAYAIHEELTAEIEQLNRLVM